MFLVDLFIHFRLFSHFFCIKLMPIATIKRSLFFIYGLWWKQSQRILIFHIIHFTIQKFSHFLLIIISNRWWCWYCCFICCCWCQLDIYLGVVCMYGAHYFFFSYLTNDLLMAKHLFTLWYKPKRCWTTYVSSCTSVKMNILPFIITLMPYTRLFRLMCMSLAVSVLYTRTPQQNRHRHSQRKQLAMPKVNRKYVEWFLFCVGRPVNSSRNKKSKSCEYF